MTGLLELAERCEAATGPDRQLDAEIWCAINGHTFERHITEIKPAVGYISGPNKWFYTRPLADILPFTASLDAAMTLASEGWSPVEILMDAINDNCEDDWLAALPRYVCAIAAARTSKASPL